MIPKTELNKKRIKKLKESGLVEVRVWITPDRVWEVKKIEAECTAKKKPFIKMALTRLSL